MPEASCKPWKQPGETNAPPVAVKNHRHQRQSVPADRDAAQSFHPLMGTSCLVVPPQHKANFSNKRKVFPQSKWEEETQRDLVGHASTGARRKEGQSRFLARLSTPGERGRETIFLTFLLCAVTAIGCLRGSSHLAPIQQHPAEPRNGFSHQGEQWGSPGLWVLNGPHWSRGHWMDPSRALGDCGNQAFLGSKVTTSVQPHPGHCWIRGRMTTCTGPQLPGSAALCALSARSSAWLSLTA